MDSLAAPNTEKSAQDDKADPERNPPFTKEMVEPVPASLPECRALLYGTLLEIRLFIPGLFLFRILLWFCNTGSRILPRFENLLEFFFHHGSTRRALLFI